jgi:hypothetical protein
LSSEAWVEYRDKPPNPGLNFTTHLALVKNSTGQLLKCYVKGGVTMDSPTPLAESLAWLIASQLDLPRPKYAGLLILRIDKLKNHLSLPPHWLKEEYMPCFYTSAVETMPNYGPKNVNLVPMPGNLGQPVLARSTTHSVTNKSILSNELVKLSAFDEWLDNQDRHSGNVLVDHKGIRTPIDNEYCFYKQFWSDKVNVTKQSLLEQAEKLLGTIEIADYKVRVAVAGRSHDSAYPAVAGTLYSLIMNYHDDVDRGDQIWRAVHQHLFERAAPNWLPATLNVII